jgi:hypothetical protein
MLADRGESRGGCEKSKEGKNSLHHGDIIRKGYFKMCVLVGESSPRNSTYVGTGSGYDFKCRWRYLPVQERHHVETAYNNVPQLLRNFIFQSSALRIPISDRSESVCRQFFRLVSAHLLSFPCAAFVPMST